MRCKHKIILTGTPLQNNLEEFFACVNIVNPNILGTLKTFKKVFMEPILKQMNSAVESEQYKIGKSRSEEL